MTTLELLEHVAHGAVPPALDAGERERIAGARTVIEDALAQGREVYGVTTGFGRLASVQIPAADAAQLQVNLVRSHAVGAGPPLPADVVRGMLLLLGTSLRRGHSGVRLEVVELLQALLERDVVPVIPSKGSVGSSGDLAPLAHLALVLIGEGEASVAGERLPGGEALARAGLQPLALSAKEGLALINGTHLMAAAGGLAVREAARLVDAAVVGDGALARGVRGADGAVRRAPARAARRSRASRSSPRACASCSPAARSWRATPTAAASRIRTRCAARRRCSAPSPTPSRYAAGALERELEGRDGQPARVPGGAATCSQAATSTGSRCRCRSITWRWRCAGKRRSPSAASTRCWLPGYAEPAGVPLAATRVFLGPDDRPVRGGGAGERVPGAVASRGRRLDPD